MFFFHPSALRPRLQSYTILVSYPQKPEAGEALTLIGKHL